MNKRTNEALETIERNLDSIEQCLAGIQVDLDDLRRDMVTKDDVKELEEAIIRLRDTALGWMSNYRVLDSTPRHYPRRYIN